MEGFIEKAIKSIVEVEIAKGEENAIPREFKGYIASFGASIIQNGLLPTIIFYDNQEANTTENRSLVNEAIYRIIRDKLEEDYPEYIYTEVTDLQTLVRRNYKGERYIKEYVDDAITALKLAMRTFPIEKVGDGNEK